MTATEVADLVAGPMWQRWISLEPGLAALPELAALRHLRGPQADQLLGALVRLAAEDGGDDALAARAVAHQLAGEAVGIAVELRDFGPEVDQVVMASLWMEIRTFPWRTRSRAYATSLRRTTRRSALRYFLYRPGDRQRLVVVAPEDISDRALSTPGDQGCGGTAEGSRDELEEYLDWCVWAERITPQDAGLMLELVAAGWATADKGLLKLKRGVCSMHAVHVVAERRGVCEKTVVRERDRVLAKLRQAAADYVREVA